jgi:hypothetical protein
MRRESSLGRLMRVTLFFSALDAIRNFMNNFAISGAMCSGTFGPETFRS